MQQLHCVRSSLPEHYWMNETMMMEIVNSALGPIDPTFPGSIELVLHQLLVVDMYSAVPTHWFVYKGATRSDYIFCRVCIDLCREGKKLNSQQPASIQEYLKMLQDTDGLAPFPDPAWMYHDQATHNHHLGVSESQVVDARTGIDLQNRLRGNSSSSSNSSSSLHHQQHPLPSHVAPQRQTRSTDDLGGDDGGVAGEPFVGRLISYQEAHHHPSSTGICRAVV